MSRIPDFNNRRYRAGDTYVKAARWYNPATDSICFDAVATRNGIAYKRRFEKCGYTLYQELSAEAEIQTWAAMIDKLAPNTKGDK